MIPADSPHDEPGWTLRYVGAMSGTVDVLQRSIFYRDHAIALSVAAGTARASSAAGKAAPVQVACHGEARELRPGCTVQFRFPE
jgi:hypothetical protein